MSRNSVFRRYVVVCAVLVALSTSGAGLSAAERDDAGIVAIAFTGEGYTGLAWKITETGKYDLRNGFDLPNDSIRSVRVRPGCMVTLYEHAGFDGEELELAADAPALPKFWVRQASSLTVEASPDYLEDWLESAEDVDDYTEFVSLADGFGSPRVRAKAERYRDRVMFFMNAGKNDWYGAATDDERVAMAGELLDFFGVFGVDFSEWTPNTLAQQMNNLFDWRSGQSVFGAACMVLGVEEP